MQLQLENNLKLSHDQSNWLRVDLEIEIANNENKQSYAGK